MTPAKIGCLTQSNRVEVTMELELSKIFMNDMGKAWSSEVTVCIYTNLCRFDSPEADGADKLLHMDETERLSNKMVNEIQHC